jgi:uncharacterized membrane protein
MIRNLAAILAALGLAGCHPAGDATVPGNSNDHAPYAGIAADETIRFTGTEPFWGGTASGTRLVYTTPERPEGTTIEVTRFAGRGGLSLSGNLDGARFDLTITPAECSDGMSDRTYPFSATLLIGPATLQGCAWTDSRGFSGSANP